MTNPIDRSKYSPYELWQLDRYGFILADHSYSGGGNREEEFENGAERADRDREWTELQAEMQLQMEDHY